MKIFVCVKQVPDTETKVKVADNGKQLDESEVTFILNPYCEYAVEEALRIKEKMGGDVTLVTVGPDSAKSALRGGLAMGADTAIHLQADDSRLADSLAIATLLANELKAQNPDLILMGKKSVDSDMETVPSMLAILMDLPAVTSVSEAEWREAGATLGKEVEGGRAVYDVVYPCIVSVDKGLNEPRYASLKGIMAAKKKTIDVKETALPSLTVETVSMVYPPVAQPGKIVGEGPEAASELVRLLREEAKVIE